MGAGAESATDIGSARASHQPTSLYAKLFINGFSKPSYIVISVRTRSAIDPDRMRRGLRCLLDAHPLLCSRVEMSRLGVPKRFRFEPRQRWFDRGGLTIEDAQASPGAGADGGRPEFERELLSTPMDLVREFPFRVWVRRNSAFTDVFAKVHHAIADAHSGKRLVTDFFTAYGGLPVRQHGGRRNHAPRERAGLRRAVTWLRDARLARVPDASVVSDLNPLLPLEFHPVSFSQRSLPPAALRDLKANARRHALTFSQSVCIALFRSFARYNRESAGAGSPQRLGLMVAVSQRFRSKTRDADGFDADTRLVSVNVDELEPAATGLLHARVREALDLRRSGHNELALGMIYAARRIRELLPRPSSGRTAAKPSVRSLHFMYSDLTGPQTSYTRPLELEPGVAVDDVRLLVSPVALEHAGLITYVYAGELRLVVLHHEGTLDADRLLDELMTELDRQRDGRIP